MNSDSNFQGEAKRPLPSAVKKQSHVSVGHTTGMLLTVIAYAAFISLGLPDAVTGVAWPSIQKEFGLPVGYFGLILVGLCSGYFISGVLAGRMMRALGIGGLLSLSCLLVSTAMGMNFLLPVWWLLIVNAMLWGLGSGAIDSGLNAYAAHHFPAKHMHWLHACYSLGAAIGPIAMSFAIVQMQSWRYGYLIVSAAMGSMMLVFVATRTQWAADASAKQTALDAEAESVGESTEQRVETVSTFAALKNPLVWLQIVAFFLYTGFEALIGQWSFTWLTQGQQVQVESAGFWVSAYFFAIGAGRVLTGFMVDHLGLDRLLRFSMLTALVGSGCMIFSGTTWLSCISLLVIGAGLAAIFPSLMSLTPRRLGRPIAAHAIGFQIAAATLGAATIPGMTGVAIQWLGVNAIGAIAVGVALGLLTIHELLVWILQTRSRVEVDK